MLYAYLKHVQCYNSHCVIWMPKIEVGMVKWE